MKLDHIGIATRSIEKGTKIWQDLFGFPLLALREVESQKLKIAIFDAGGGVRIELLEPKGEDSPVAKFLERRGEGIHHLCFAVKGIEKVLEILQSKGIKLVDEVPKRGVSAKKIAFLHPSSTNGVLIELCEK